MGLFTEYRQVTALLKEEQEIIFYAENRHYFQYFQPLIDNLLHEKIGITYITSDTNDPLLNDDKGMKVVYSRYMLGFLFPRLRSKVMIMTMPDLDNYLFKRSPGVRNYIYMFHAAVSTHQQYNKKAFFHYDSIFCTGPYQEDEIRMAELLYHQKAKTLVRYGYPLLDRIRFFSNSEHEPYLLIAPSWFNGCIFDCCIEELLEQLKSLPYKIKIRSHPEFERRKKNAFRKIKRMAEVSDRISIDDNPSVIQSLANASVLITDRSGIAFEYAFGVGKPVLFVDTVLKQVNPVWMELNIIPMENSIRSEIGVAVSATELSRLPQKIKELEEMKIGFDEKILQLKQQHFFNSPESFQKGFDYVKSLLNP